MQRNNQPEENAHCIQGAGTGAGAGAGAGAGGELGLGSGSGLGLDTGIHHPRLIRRARAIQRELQLANNHRNNNNDNNSNNDDNNNSVPCIISELGTTLFGLDVL